MARAGAYAGADALFDVPTSRRVVEKGNMLLPRQAHHDAEPVPVRSVQQPARRHRVCADGIESICRHLSEIALDGFRIAVFFPVLIRTKSAVSYPSNPELGIVGVEKFSQRNGPRCAGTRGIGKQNIRFGRLGLLPRQHLHAPE